MRLQNYHNILRLNICKSQTYLFVSLEMEVVLSQRQQLIIIREVSKSTDFFLFVCQLESDHACNYSQTLQMTKHNAVVHESLRDVAFFPRGNEGYVRIGAGLRAFDHTQVQEVVVIALLVYG